MNQKNKKNNRINIRPLRIPLNQIKVVNNTSRQRSTEQSSNLVPNFSSLSKIKYGPKSIIKGKPESNSKVKDFNCDNYLYDLIKTMQINIKIILDATQILKMKQENKNLIAKRIEIIHKLFDNFQLMRKKIENIKSKNLVNNQIYEEVKRRINENKKFYDEKIEDINSLVKKKVIILKKVQKKFLEIQIYIRRESQNYYGFRKQFSNFSITPFILENEYLNKYKSKLNESFEEKINRMKTLNVPIKEIKSKNKNKKNKEEKNNINIIIINENGNEYLNNNNINNDLISLEDTSDKLNKYLINKQEEIKFYENKKINLKKINLVYKSKVVRKKSAFKNEINISISQDLQNNNEISMINQTNNNENLESNINNTFYELFTVESMAKSGIYNSTFIQDDEICK